MQEDARVVILNKMALDPNLPAPVKTFNVFAAIKWNPSNFAIQEGETYVMSLICLEVCYSILLLSYSISSGALESPDLLLSYSMITLALHNTIILIITHLST